ARDVNVSLAPAREFLVQRLTLAECADIQIGVLIDFERAVAARTRRDQAESPLRAIAQSLLLVAGLESGRFGQNPNLQKMQRLRRRRVELAMLDSGPGRHPL